METIRTQTNWDKLAPVVRNVLSKSKSGHPLRFDTNSNDPKLKLDKPNLGIVYLEAPYISLPNYDILKLIERGKCCAFCGSVLKIYDNGKMKDDGNKQNREKQTSIDKHERYLNGLDCANCECRWCDKQCKDLDFKHNLLYHRPANKNVTHPFINVTKIETDTFYYDKWSKLENIINEENLELCYKGIMCILQVYYDPNLKNGYESLKCLTSTNEIDYEKYLSKYIERKKLIEVHELFNLCFKKNKILYLDFLKYLVIFDLNNYNGSIYLIFSAIKKSKTIEPNLKIEYFDGNTKTDYEEFVVKTGGHNSVQLFKHHITDNPMVKPIYTNKTSGIFDKKIIEIANLKGLTQNSELVLLDQDYSNPLDLENDEMVSFNDKASNIPKIILPISNVNNIKMKPKVRNASFTSSGTSFGEGIIKYNRDQIREMLENMSNDFINEESSDTEDLDEAIDDDQSSGPFVLNDQDIVSMVRNLQNIPNATQRRKSVKFEESIKIN